MTTFPEPDINETASHLAVRISTNPGRYTPGMRDLAKAYESQRERIADLEEDVERLRPKEAFVSEVLFAINMSGPRFCIETECRGGLTVTMDHNDISHVLELFPDDALELTTALNKWAGLDGVEWREIDGDPPDGHMNSVLLMDHRNDDRSHVCGWHKSKGDIGWPFIMRPTHWAPLPKPPVVKS